MPGLEDDGMPLGGIPPRAPPAGPGPAAGPASPPPSPAASPASSPYGEEIAHRPLAGADEGQVAQRTLGGIRWTGLSLVLRTAFQFGVGVILARLLDPSDFGLLALAAVFTHLVALFRDYGVTNALTRQPVMTEAHLSTGFWLNLAMGVFWALVLAGLGWPAAWFFQEPRLKLLLAVLAINVVLASFGGVRRAIMGRQMRFAESTRVEVSSVVIGGIVAAVAAFSGAGVWALVAQTMATTIAGNVLGWPLVRHRPKAMFSRPIAKELLSFGFHSVNTNLLTYVYRYLDNILIGRFLGATSLGLYDFAYRRFRQPMLQARQVLSRVMFPALVALQAKEEQFDAMYRRSSRYLSAILVGGFVLLFAAAEDFTLGVYGDHWAPAIEVTRILALAGMAQCLIMPTGWIYQSKGRMALAFRNSITFGLVPTVAAFAIGLRWGIEGVAWAVLAVSVLVLYPGLKVPLGLTKLRVGDVAFDLGQLVLAGLIAGLAGLLTDRFLTTGLPHLVAFPIQAAVAGLVYVAGLWLTDRRLVRDLLRVGLGVVGVGKKKPKRGPAA